MNTRICLSIGAMDAQFEKMIPALQKCAEVDVVGLKGFSLKGYDIFIGKKLSPEILNTADRLKAVFAYKTGVDDFPLPLLKEKGIPLVNSHVDADYVAEYAFGLGVSLVNRITECDKRLRKGIWHDQKNPYWKSIFSMKIGLLGYGHIGKKLHEILARNHIETYTIDRGKAYENIGLVPSFEALCKTCDLLMISLPSTPETDGLFNETAFGWLKGKYIVNVGRSNCIDQKALYEALKSGRLAGAAIDTWDEKPKKITDFLLPSKFPLDELYNIVLSPHQATRVQDGHARYVTDTLEKVMAFMKDGTLTDTVDYNKGY